MNLFGVYGTFVAVQLLLGLAYVTTQGEAPLVASWVVTMIFIAWLEWR